jgi:hypothetical protein
MTFSMLWTIAAVAAPNSAVDIGWLRSSALR